jgi:hypothetical protein
MSLNPAGNRTTINRSSSTYPGHYADHCYKELNCIVETVFQVTYMIDNYLPFQELLMFLCNLKYHHRTHKIPQSALTLLFTNAVYTFIPSSSRISFSTLS